MSSAPPAASSPLPSIVLEIANSTISHCIGTSKSLYDLAFHPVTIKYRELVLDLISENKSLKSHTILFEAMIPHFNDWLVEGQMTEQQIKKAIGADVPQKCKESDHPIKAMAGLLWFWKNELASYAHGDDYDVWYTNLPEAFGDRVQPPEHAFTIPDGLNEAKSLAHGESPLEIMNRLFTFMWLVKSELVSLEPHSRELLRGCAAFLRAVEAEKWVKYTPALPRWWNGVAALQLQGGNSTTPAVQPTDSDVPTSDM